MRSLLRLFFRQTISTVVFHHFAAGSHLRGLQHVRQAAVEEKGGNKEFRNKKVKEFAQGKKKKKETAEHKRERR